jgi:hypothetical protein
MSAASAMLRGRVMAEQLMVDACTITFQTGVTTNDLTGVVTPTTSPRYTGKCKMQIAGVGGGNRTDVGEVSLLVLRLELHLPAVGSESVSRGDLVTITASAHDAALVGRTFLVRDVFHKSFETARRMGIEETT